MQPSLTVLLRRDGLVLDANGIAGLASAMNEYAAAHPGFSTAAAVVMPTYQAIQGAWGSWHRG